MLRSWSLLVLVTATLAGCAAVEAPHEEALIDIGPIEEGKGAIVGVVVDDAVRPVPNARVTLLGPDTETATDENGAFALRDLEPGTYFLRVEKPGYHPGQQSVDVQAGKVPPVTKVLLLADEATRPFYEQFKFSGFLQCSVRFVVNALAACQSLPDGIGDDEYLVEYTLARVPTFVQSEMVWQSTQPLGDSLRVMYTDYSVSPFVNYVVDTGTSPLLLQADAELLAERGIGADDRPLTIRAFTGDYEDTGLSLTLNQGFEVITHVFYGYVPPEDWRFIDHGNPPEPPA